MQRRIVEFGQDEIGDWVALLDCGHRQHVRHNPPFTNRPWVETEAGRGEQLGQELACPLCDRFEFPNDFAPYKRTPEFTEATVPAGLTSNHSTKAGVWAKINVVEGRLRYRVDPLNAEFELSSAAPGIVVPQVVHYVEPMGSVRFYVEFYRAQPGAGIPKGHAS
jgi:tellurite resistance-related uncharacterized protein